MVQISAQESLSDQFKAVEKWALTLRLAFSDSYDSEEKASYFDDEKIKQIGKLFENIYRQTRRMDWRTLRQLEIHSREIDVLARKLAGMRAAHKAASGSFSDLIKISGVDTRKSAKKEALRLLILKNINVMVSLSIDSQKMIIGLIEIITLFESKQLTHAAEVLESFLENIKEFNKACVSIRYDHRGVGEIKTIILPYLNSAITLWSQEETFIAQFIAAFEQAQRQRGVLFSQNIIAQFSLMRGAFANWQNMQHLLQSTREVVLFGRLNDPNKYPTHRRVSFFSVGEIQQQYLEVVVGVKIIQKQIKVIIDEFPCKV